MFILENHKKNLANSQKTTSESERRLEELVTINPLQQAKDVVSAGSVAEDSVPVVHSSKSENGSDDQHVYPNSSPKKGDSGNSKNSKVSESKSPSDLGIGIVHSVFSTLGSLSKESSGRWYILLCIISLLILDAVNSLVTKVLVYTGVPMYAGVSSLLLHFILRLIAAGIFDLSVWYVLKAVLKDKDKPVELKDNQGHVITKEHIIAALLLLINLLYIIFNVICVVLSGKYEELNLGIIFAAFILIMTQN